MTAGMFLHTPAGALLGFTEESKIVTECIISELLTTTGTFSCFLHFVELVTVWSFYSKQHERDVWFPLRISATKYFYPELNFWRSGGALIIRYIDRAAAHWTWVANPDFPDISVKWNMKLANVTREETLVSPRPFYGNRGYIYFSKTMIN